MKKIRLDKLLVKNDYFKSRSKAQFNIESGAIRVNGKKITKNSFYVKENDSIDIVFDACPYVSKGGLKLEKAINHFDLDFTDKNVLDIGASTGGFTDCALQHGANFVTAIDVGVDQLVEDLRNNRKVKSKENFNLKEIVIDTFDDKFDIVITDVSFISLKHVFDILDYVLIETGKFISLIKPQFEVGKNKTKKGIVRNKNMHKYAINSVVKYALMQGYSIRKLTYSPIKGNPGNIEFLALFIKEKSTTDFKEVDKVVNRAHRELK